VVATPSAREKALAPFGLLLSWATGRRLHFLRRRRRSYRRHGFRFNPNSEMEMAAVSSCDLVAVPHKAVLKHAQSRRWRDVRCGPANAKRLDCGRFIAAVARPTSNQIRRQYPVQRFANFGFRV